MSERRAIDLVGRDRAVWIVEQELKKLVVTLRDANYSDDEIIDIIEEGTDIVINSLCKGEVDAVEQDHGL